MYHHRDVSWEPAYLRIHGTQKRFDPIGRFAQEGAQHRGLGGMHGWGHRWHLWEWKPVKSVAPSECEE